LDPKAIESIGRWERRRQAVSSGRGFLQLGPAGAGMLVSTTFGFIRRAFAGISGGTLDAATVSNVEAWSP
jgi:hypothetical protein